MDETGWTLLFWSSAVLTGNRTYEDSEFDVDGFGAVPF